MTASFVFNAGLTVYRVGAGEQPEPRAVALLSVLQACRLLYLVFTKDERKAAGQK